VDLRLNNFEILCYPILILFKGIHSCYPVTNDC
jgi:hypothetical protein